MKASCRCSLMSHVQHASTISSIHSVEDGVKSRQCVLGIKGSSIGLLGLQRYRFLAGHYFDAWSLTAIAWLWRMYW
jgi:hypothetical protein